MMTPDKICVLGDVMLDTYVECAPVRVSSEAPVIIAREVKQTHCPGGAGNVAANLARGFGNPVVLIGVAGFDSAYHTLHTSLQVCGIESKYVIRSVAHQTIEKIRYVDGLGRQMFRLDREAPARYASEVVEQLRALLRKSVAECRGLVVSDYAKGTCSEELVRYALELFRSHGKFTVVNGKPGNHHAYHDASVLIYNAAEAMEVLGVKAPIPSLQIAASLRATTHFEGSLIVTLGADGMVFANDGTTAHIPAVPVSVADVAGAGDTVTATVAFHGGCSGPILQVAADYAASVVSQHGTSIVEAI